MNIFLTGGTGFIGRRVARTMRARGWSVECLVRRPDSAEADVLAALGCTLVKGDVTDANGLAAAMAGADVVVHNAGVYELGVTNETAARMQAVNVDGTENVLTAAGEAGVPKTVYVSSVIALDPESHAHDPDRPANAPFRDPRDRSPYARSKAEAHEVALRHRHNGLGTINVMPNIALGPDDHSAFAHFIRLYIMGRNLPLAFGADARVAPVDVDLLAEGICLAVEKGTVGGDYCFGGTALTFRELFAVFGEQPGGMKVRVFLPRWFMRPQMRIFESLLRRKGMSAFMSRELVDSSKADYDFSSERSETELGWQRPHAPEMYRRIFEAERELMAERTGFFAKLAPSGIPSKGL